MSQAVGASSVMALLSSSIQAWARGLAYYVDRDARVIKRVPDVGPSLGPLLTIGGLPWGYEGDTEIRFKRVVGDFYIATDDAVYTYDPDAEPGEEFTSTGWSIDMTDCHEEADESGSCFVALDAAGAVWAAHDYSELFYPSALSSLTKIYEPNNEGDDPAEAIGIIYCQEFVEDTENDSITCFDAEGSPYLYDSAPIVAPEPSATWERVSFPCWRVDGEIFVFNCRGGEHAETKKYADAQCVQHFGYRGMTRGPDFKDVEDRYVRPSSSMSSLYESYITYGSGAPKFYGLAGAPYIGIEHYPSAGFLDSDLEITEWGAKGCADCDTEVTEYDGGELLEDFLNVDFFDYEKMLADNPANVSYIPRLIMTQGSASAGTAKQVVDERGSFDYHSNPDYKYTLTAKAYVHSVGTAILADGGDDQQGPPSAWYTQGAGPRDRCGYIQRASQSSAYAPPSFVIGEDEITSHQLAEDGLGPDPTRISDSAGIAHGDRAYPPSPGVFYRPGGIYMPVDAHTMKKLKLEKEDGTLVEFSPIIKQAGTYGDTYYFVT